MNRAFSLGVSLSLLSACGAAEVAVEALPPVVLHELDATPGCYVPPGPPAPGSTVSIATQMYEMNLSFAIQHAELLLQPILEAPTAGEWQWQGEDPVTTRIEGTSLARGEGWGELIVVLVGEAFSTRADVHYDPYATVIELTRGTLIQTDNFVRTDEITLGCDPGLRWSFRMAGGRVECWDERGDPLAPSSPDPTREDLEMQMSATMQCMMAIQRTVRF